ncbi:MAG: DUF6599 family protein [Planctomycetota bacterium]
MKRTKLLPKRRSRNPSAVERITGIAILLLVAGVVGLVATGGAGDDPAGRPAAPEPAENSPEEGKLPLKSPSGWPRGEIESYDAETVFEKINGKADIFLEYGFRELLVASWSDPADPSRYVDVYAYDQATPLSALGIYRVQRSGAEEAVAEADEACASGASAFGRWGRWYVEVIGSDEGVEAEVRALLGPACEALGPREEAEIPDWFPEEGRTSIGYSPSNALGVEVLTNCFLVGYDDGVTVVAGEYPDEAAAKAAAEIAAEELDFLGTPIVFGNVGRVLVGVADGADDARRKALLAAVVAKVEASR